MSALLASGTCLQLADSTQASIELPTGIPSPSHPEPTRAMLRSLSIPLLRADAGLDEVRVVHDTAVRTSDIEFDRSGGAAASSISLSGGERRCTTFCYYSVPWLSPTSSANIQSVGQ